MWQKQSNTLIITDSSIISVRFNCPTCGTQNTFDDIYLPAFSDNYEKVSESDVSEEDLRQCSNNNCQAELKIDVSNGAGGFLVQVPNVSDYDIKIDV